MQEGINILHLWFVRSFENLFWGINLNCKEKYEKIICIAKEFFNKIYYSLLELPI